MVQIAKQWKKLGGEAVFFSHGGEREDLAKEVGFKVRKVEPISSQEDIQRLWEYDRF